MKTLVNIIISLFLVVVLTCGIQIAFVYLSQTHKKEFRTFIEKHKNNLNLKILNINPSELYIDNPTTEWLDGNKEIRHNGVLYDIVAITNKNGKTILTLVNDHQEELLQKNYAALFKNIPNKNHKKLLKIFFAYKCILNQQLCLKQSIRVYACFFYWHNYYKNHYLSVDYLPPKVSFVF